MTDVIMFSRPGCHLCDDARDAMRGADVEFQEIDISGDAALTAEHGPFVPVVEVSGQIVFHAGMDASTLPEIVAEARGL